MQKTLIVIPTYDERENVRPIAQDILANVPDVHILFVDDNSPDGTGKILDAMVSENPQIHVLHRAGKMGLGKAYIAGFKWGLEQNFDLLFEMDADFSHDPKAIRSFIDAAQSADLVLGTRYKGGIRILNWPLSRLMMSIGAGIFVRAVTGMPISDPTGGFKCFRKEVLQAIDLDSIKSNGYSFQMEMTHTAWCKGFRIAEVPIVFEDRRSGYSKLNKAIARESFWMVWRLAWRNRFRRKPPKKVERLKG